MQWDVFCRVVDNFGDIGVCWRLAADLASRGERVRLWADDASALAWMAPRGHAGVTVLPCVDQASPPAEPGDVVVEAFGCDPPSAFVQRMALRRPAPVWINLEYLSAEGSAERNHGLPSPQLAGPGAGLGKWFFYPGFTRATGGLLREAGLIGARHAFDADRWLQRLGIATRAGERRVSLFCYDNPALPGLLHRLAGAPTLLLVTPGHAARQVQRELGPSAARGELRAVHLPHLTQPDYDALLWSCDLNFVRGEDSFVRAQWAGVPFVWHLYPQHDGAHAAKLEAFLGRFLATADPALAGPLRSLWRAWNGLSPDALDTIDTIDTDRWRGHCLQWREGLLDQADLGTQLLRFVAERRP
jgi:uncharacterized repeat protein (TIGR03837 family)